MRTVRAAVVLLLLSITFAAAGAHAPAAGAQAAGGEGDVGLVIRLAQVPADREDDPRANQYVVDHVEPGGTVQRKIEVRNATSAPMTAKLYAGGAAVKDGAFVPDDSGQGSGAELAAWTSVTPPSVSLEPGQMLSATVKIAVPASAQGGERYGAVWAELPASPAPGGGGISTVNRVGIRIYLSVGGGDEPPTKFSLPRFTPIRDSEGRPAIEIAACNDGELAVDLAGSLTLSNGPGGVSAGPFESPPPAVTLAPGQCSTVTVLLSPDLPLGPWDASATLKSGPHSASASARITFPSAAGTSSPPVEAKPKDVTGTTGGRLALLLALLLLLLVLLLLWWLWRRRRSDEDEEDEGEGGPPPVVARH
jgi:hypothetical protein